MQHRRLQARAVGGRVLPVSNRLADVVRGHGRLPTSPLDRAPGLQALVRRRGDAVALGIESFSRSTAEMGARRALSLPFHDVRESQRRLVDPRARGCVPAAAFRPRPEPPPVFGTARLALSPKPLTAGGSNAPAWPDRVARGLRRARACE